MVEATDLGILAAIVGALLVVIFIVMGNSSSTRSSSSNNSNRDPVRDRSSPGSSKEDDEEHSEETEEESEDYDGNRWEILIQIIKEADLNQNIEDQLIFILKSRDRDEIVNRFNLKAVYVSQLIYVLSNVRIEEIVDVGKAIVSYIEKNQITNINNRIIQEITTTVEVNFTVVTNYISNSSQKGSMSGLGFGTLVEHIEQEAQTEEEILKLDKDAVEELKKVQEWYENNERWIRRLDDVVETNHTQNMSPAKVSEVVNQVNANTGSDIDLANHDFVVQKREAAERMLSHLDRALNDLREANQKTKELEHDEQEVAKKLDQIEDEFREEIKVANEVLNKRAGTGQRNP